MKIKREILKKALEIVKPGLATKEEIEQTSKFAFIKGHVITFNNEISIAHPIDLPDLEGVVPARELYDTLSRMSGETVDLTLRKSNLIVRSGKAKAGLSLNSEIRLPLEEISQSDNWETLPDNFTKQIHFVTGSVSKDQSLPILSTIHITSESAEATDSFRIAYVKWNKKLSDDVDMLIPAKSLLKVIKIKPVKIAYSNSWVQFKNEEGTVISCRVYINEEFPKVSQFLKLDADYEITMPDNIQELLYRAEVFAKREHPLDESITITLSKGNIIFESKSDSGWFKEYSSIDYNGAEFTFIIVPYLFDTIIERTKVMKLNDKFIIFSGEDWKYITVYKEKL